MKVIIGLSGGVDSSVSAHLLKEAGFEVEGLFMKNWEEDDTTHFCHAAEDIKDAESVCNQLNIPLHIANFSKEYWELVFENFLEEYQKGRTPNPDILCNREIKFNVFLNYALSLGADFIATGHYARKETLTESTKSTDSTMSTDSTKSTVSPVTKLQYLLKKGQDPNKDQSYFLYTLSQKALSKTLFPIGGLEKKEVREIALKIGLSNHHKKDSTGLCFIGERKFKDFLKRFTGNKPGPIVTAEGKNLGLHDGLMFYTLGQRQGLKIGGQANSLNQPWYVVDKRMEDNALIVATGENHPLLYKTNLIAKELHWIVNEPSAFERPFFCHAKIRYRQKEVPCTLFKQDENSYHIQFEKPERAVTPGQSIVFYEEDICLGGGIIQ